MNDYLARRDGEWMAPLYRALGLTALWLSATSTAEERRAAYGADVTYAAVSEVGFDLLRDRQAVSAIDQVSPRTDVAIVDEADSVMIDEARVPLVLAGSRDEGGDPDRGARVARAVASLTPGLHYETDQEHLNVFLTLSGEWAVEAALGGIDLYSADNTMSEINTALDAWALLQRDVHYVVRDGHVRLINSGRGGIATLQRWPDGLQEAVEAKENLTTSEGAEILDSLTVQGLLHRYEARCGMTGTALAASDQLRTFYDARVSLVPPSKPRQRVDLPDRVYATLSGKNDAIMAEIRRVHATGRPVLACTLNVAESEGLAARLASDQIPCVVLNAKNDAEEGAIVANAGKLDAVTISTQIAGRGTDIRLGGPDERDREAVVPLGGLYVIGTGHHPEFADR